MSRIGNRGYIPFRSVGLAAFSLPAMLGLLYLAVPSKEEGQNLQRRQTTIYQVLETAMGTDQDFTTKEKLDLAQALGCEIFPFYSIEFEIPEMLNRDFTITNGKSRCYVPDSKLENYLKKKHPLIFF